MMRVFLFVLIALVSFQTYAASNLSVEQVRAVKKYYEENDFGAKVDSSTLAGAAKKKFGKLQKVTNCRSYGYCPVAFNATIDGVDVVAVVVQDDGGTQISVFTREGELIAEGSAGESGDLHWS